MVRRRRLIIWFLVAAVVAAALLYTLGPRLLARPVAASALHAVFGDCAQVGSVDFDAAGSVVLREVVITPTDSSRPLFRADKITAKISPAGLLALGPTLSNIKIEGFSADFSYNADTGRWNFESVRFNRPTGDGRLPVVAASGGRLNITRLEHGREATVLSTPVSLEIAPAEDAPKTRRISLSSPVDNPPLNIEALWNRTSKEMTLTGRVGQLYCPVMGNTLTIAGLSAALHYDDNSLQLANCEVRLGENTLFTASGAIKDLSNRPAYSLQLHGKNVPVTPETTPNAMVYSTDLLAHLPAGAQRFFQRYNPQGLVDFSLQIAGTWPEIKTEQMSGHILCRNARVCYEKFPYPIEHLTGRINFTGSDFTLEPLKGRHGPAQFTITGSTVKTESGRRNELALNVRDLQVDNELWSAMGPGLKKLWFVFAPSGRVDADYHLQTSPAEGKRRRLNLHLADVDAVCQYFPYPLEHLTGEITVKNSSADVQKITSEFAGRKVTISGRADHIRSGEPEFDFLITAENIPMDSTLRDSLSARQKKLYDQFEIDGRTDARLKVTSAGGEISNVRYSGRVAINADTFLYKKIPVELTNVQALLDVNRQQIKIDRFHGDCNTGRASLTGQIVPPTEDRPIEYDLTLDADAVELDQELARALPGHLGETLEQLNARGGVNLTGRIAQKPSANRPDYELAVECLDTGIDYDKLAYPWHNITGLVQLAPGRLSLHEVSATADTGAEKTHLQVDGDISFNDRTIQKAELGLTGENFVFDDPTTQLLEAIWPGVVTHLSPAGRFDIAQANLNLSYDAGGNRNVQFAGRVKPNACRFGRDDLAEDVSATADVRILHHSEQGLLQGQVSVESGRLQIEGKQLTDATAQFVYDPAQKRWSSEDFLARCYDGKVTGSVEIIRNTGWEYTTQVYLEGINLAKFLAAGQTPARTPPPQPQDAPSESQTSASPEPAPTKGTLSGWGSMSGKLGNTPGRLGRLRLTVENMQIGRLSLLARIVAALKLSFHQQPAFSRMRLDAFLEGDRVLLERVDLLGQAVSMRGRGNLILSTRQINADFAATLMGLKREPTLLQSLAIGLGPAFVKVEVRGNLSDPKITTRPLPMVKESLEILGTKKP